MKYSEKLYLRYKEEIESWNWQGIKKDAMTNCFYDSYNNDNCIVASTFLGTVFALYPSGKYYMPWTTNQTAKDVIKDEQFSQALEEVAESNDMYITCGEGDPCDIMAQFVIHFDEYKELEDQIIFVTNEDHEIFESHYRDYLAESE